MSTTIAGATVNLVKAVANNVQTLFSKLPRKESFTADISPVTVDPTPFFVFLILLILLVVKVLFFF